MIILLRSLLLTIIFCQSVIVISAGAAQTVKISTGDNYPPFVTDKLPQGGWSQAIILAVFKQMQLTTKVEVLPWDRALMWTGENQYLGTFPYVYSKQRAEQFLYSQPINHLPVRLYVNQSSAIERLEQLRGARFCLPYGYSIDLSPGSLYQKMKFTINHAKDSNGCIAQVQKGWSDAGLLNGYMANSDSVEKGIRLLDEELGSVSLHFLIAKSHPEAQQWMKKFNTALAEITTSGERAKIDQRFKQIMLATN